MGNQLEGMFARMHANTDYPVLVRSSRPRATNGEAGVDYRMEKRWLGLGLMA